MEQCPRQAGGIRSRIGGRRRSGASQQYRNAPTHRQITEATLKGKIRFGILGAFAAIAGVVGVVSSAKPVEVSAQVPAGLTVTKTCPGGSTVNITATTNCTVVINDVAATAVPGGDIVITLSPATTGNGTNPTYGRARLLNGTTGAIGAFIDGVNVVNPSDGTAQKIVIHCLAGICLFPGGGAGTITATEAIQGAVGGSVVESIQFSVPNAQFPGAVPTVPVTLSPSITVNPATVTPALACNPPTIVAASGVAGQAACTVSFTDNDIFPNFVSTGTVTLVLTGPAGVVFGTTGTTTAVLSCGTVANSPQGCQNVAFNILSNTGGVSGPVTVTVSYNPDIAAVDTQVVAFPLAAGLTIGAANAGTTETLTCGSVVLNAGSGAAGQITCTVTMTDTSAPTTTVSSGNVVVTLTGAQAGVVLANGTTTQTFRCPTSGVTNTNDSCSSITFTVTSNTANLTGTFTVTAAYTPDLPQFDNATTATTTIQLSNSLVVGAFLQPAGLIISCPSTVDAFVPQGVPFNTPTPSQLNAVNVIALGVLPSTLVCTVKGVAADGTTVLTNFAPGTIEVSSVNGVILDATGRFSTDIRIGCDASGIINVPTLVAGTTISVNTCTGVSFAVSGIGVGNVEIRARYEPSSVAAAAGILERETVANVGFIAPIVVPSLLLSPNPVAVGGTGTATVRFNRSINCQAAFNTGLLAPPSLTGINGGNVCIDPTTGQPIIFNFGSTLNGNVILTISDTTIAQWNEAVTPTNIASPQSTGFTSTVAQVVRRCGFFPTTGIVSTGGQFPSVTGSLSNFFGGCDTVNAVYKGITAGFTNISATFIPDLPGAFGNATGVTAPAAAFLGLFANGSFATSSRVLTVENAAPSGLVQLARGCNNVSPTVSEAATAYAARVSPAAALVAIWEHQAATNTFRGFSPLPAAPSDLAAVTRLRPVFVCVSGAATLDQPAV
jgi:hypothetical protein